MGPKIILGVGSLSISVCKVGQFCFIFVLSYGLQRGGTNFNQMHNIRIVNAGAFVYSWSGDCVNENSAVMQCATLCIPGRTEGDKDTKYAHPLK